VGIVAVRIVTTSSVEDQSIRRTVSSTKRVVSMATIALDLKIGNIFHLQE